MKYILICLILFAGMAAPVIATGQDYNYTHYTTKDGLAGETVYTLLQDHNGFLWIGTETGLSRFDGQQFKNFTVAEGLPTNEVFGCYEDSQQRVWILSFSNELCYYKNGRIYNAKNNPVLKNLKPVKPVEYLLEGEHEEIIVGDARGNLVILTKDNVVKRYKPGSYRVPAKSFGRHISLPADAIQFPEKISAEIAKQLKGYKESDVSVHFEKDLSLISWGRRSVLIWDNRKGKMIPDHGLFITTRMVLDSVHILESYKYGGAAIYDYISGRRSQSFLPNYIVNGAFLDRDQNLWFGTRGNGLFKLGSSRIHNYQLNHSHETSPVQFLHFRDDRLYVGTDKAGFWQLTVTHLKDRDSVPLFTKQQQQQDLSWLMRHAPNRYVNYAGAEFLRMPFLASMNASVKSIYTFGDTFLIAHSFGAYLYKPGVPEKYLHADRVTGAIRHGNNYYIGTLQELLVLDQTGKFVSRPLSCRISYFAPGKDGILWVGTYDAGVFALKDGRVKSVINRRNTGISSDLCRCLFVDGNMLWIGTDKGINRVAIQDSGFSLQAVYSRAGGLSTDIVNAVLVKDDIVYAGTSGGLNMFNAQFPLASSGPDIRFTAMQSADTNSDWDRPLVLPHDGNHITFQFSGISFLSEKITYRYRLLGLNNQWQVTNMPSVSFISLPSGSYTLQVQATNAVGKTSAVIEKHFSVTKALYEQWWFRVAAVFLVLGLLFLLIQLNIRRIKKRERDKSAIRAKIVELEQMALRAQMNPHFIFNCLNSVQNYILKQDALGANLYLARFARLIRQTLDHAPKQYISLREEIDYLTHYVELEQLQANRHFDFIISHNPEARLTDILVPNMLIQPFVENAIKHGLSRKEEDARLEITFTATARELVCMIQDNGPGINQVKRTASPGRASKGLSITEERIRILNMQRSAAAQIVLSITDRSGTGASGTRVLVCIPLPVPAHGKS